MTGQISQLMSYFSPDVVVHCACSRGSLLGPGVWKGADALQSITRLTDENFQPLEYEILDILVDGPKAVVRWRGAWRHHATAQVCSIDAAHFLHWRSGLVIEMHEFFECTSDPAWGSATLPSADGLFTEMPPGLDRDEIERRVRRLVSFPSNGPQIDVILKFCSPNIVCDFVGDRARIPYAGRHVGIEALINIVRAVAIDFEQSHFEISEILIDGARVAGCRKVAWRHRGTGRGGWVDLANFVRFGNGMIVELIEFRDSVTLREMSGDG